MSAIFEKDLEVDQGGDFFFTTDPWVENGTPVDFSTATARMMIRRRAGDDEVLASLTTTDGADGLLTLNGTAGTATIWIKKAATAGFDFPIGRQDVFVDFADGTSRKLLSGRCLVSLSATR